MRVLIATEPEDSHAVLVKCALEKTGHAARLLFMADQPTKQTNSLFIDNQCFGWTSADTESITSESEYDVVWWRRPRKPYIPKHLTHPDDYYFVVRENNLFYESIMYNLAPNAFWANDKAASARASSKILQLRTAVACGMQIPTTFCSNDPKEIRYFILRHEEEGVIYKAMSPGFWSDLSSVRVSYTAKVEFPDLPSNRVLQITPGIFQKEIQKKYELRVTAFGDYIVAAKIDSQSHMAGRLDWRAIRDGKLFVTPYVLPLELEAQIREMMRSLGIVFGAFDFIVTPDNEYIFLEVNEQGQFLWIEDINPIFPMLDIFVQFLLNQSVHFQWNSNLAEHSILQYTEQVQAYLLQNRRNHIDPRSFLWKE